MVDNITCWDVSLPLKNVQAFSLYPRENLQMNVSYSHCNL